MLTRGLGQPAKEVKRIQPWQLTTSTHTRPEYQTTRPWTITPSCSAEFNAPSSPKPGAGGSAAELKTPYLRRHRIPGRMYDSVRISLEGKIAAFHESRDLNITSLRAGISGLERDIRKARDAFRKHQKTRRLGILKQRLASLLEDREQGRVRIAFGSRKLWRKQFDLKANGYRSHAEWLSNWREARSNEFFVMGAREEKGGCQLCSPSVQEDGLVALRLRLPDCLADTHGKYLEIRDLSFHKGQAELVRALAENTEFLTLVRTEDKERARAKQAGEPAPPGEVRRSPMGRPLSFRFKRDPQGWRVFVSFRIPRAETVTDAKRGLLGVDINADHLAVTETNSDGNWLRSWRVPLVTYGKSTNQALALTGRAVKELVGRAEEAGKPLVIERLDFQEKKTSLRRESRRQARIALQLRLLQSQDVHPLPVPPGGGAGLRREPGLFIGDRPVQISGTLRANDPPGRGPGPGPALRLLLRIPAFPSRIPGRGRVPGHSPGAREEAGKTCLDLLGGGVEGAGPAHGAQRRRGETLVPSTGTRSAFRGGSPRRSPLTRFGGRGWSSSPGC